VAIEKIRVIATILERRSERKYRRIVAMDNFLFIATTDVVTPSASQAIVPTQTLG
jgi:hypothetical protein